MTANIKITYDESTLGRLYLWLLSLNDETLAVDQQNIENQPELSIAAPTLNHGDGSSPGSDRT